MATLEKRVQVLFDPEQYARVEAEAQARRMSVGAYIREAVDDHLAQKRADAQAALRELFARADAHPIPAPTAEEWETQKEELLNRPALMDIG